MESEQEWTKRKRGKGKEDGKLGKKIIGVGGRVSGNEKGMKSIESWRSKWSRDGILCTGKKRGIRISLYTEKILKLKMFEQSETSLPHFHFQ